MISKEINRIKNELPQGVNLVAVSKFHTVEKIMEAYNAGQKIFAESRPQELYNKVDKLPKDIEWHFIGNLQTNKIKLVVPYVKLIHSVGSEKLLFEIEKYCLSKSLRVNCLLELYIAQEETKQGFSPKELVCLLDKLEHEPLKCVDICGLMGMASFTTNQEQIRGEFRQISNLFKEIKNSYPQLSKFNELSIGMSGDYKIAVEEGSTMVRIGTQIFGERQY